jgi:hypothetical protein
MIFQEAVIRWRSLTDLQDKFLGAHFQRLGFCGFEVFLLTNIGHWMGHKMSKAS